MTPRQEAYRCAQCRHGRHLSASAAAVVTGPLAPDGTLGAHDHVDEAYLHEDSIQCDRHPDAEIQRFGDGEWCRWWRCDGCKGRGRVSQSWNHPDGVPCRGEAGARLRPFGGASGPHEGWVPIRLVKKAS